MGLDGSQACINFCFGYSVFLEAHLQVIINSLECWQNIQTCRQASDDTTLGKSSGSRPDSEQGGRERSMLETELGKVASPCPCAPSTKGRRRRSLSHSHPSLTLDRAHLCRSWTWEVSSWLSPAFTPMAEGQEQKGVSKQRGSKWTLGSEPPRQPHSHAPSRWVIWEERKERQERE